MTEKSCLVDLYEFVFNNIFILADAKSGQLDNDYVYDDSSGYGFLAVISSRLENNLAPLYVQN